MSKLNGLQIVIRNNRSKQTLLVDPDGYLGDTISDDVQIEVQVEPGSNMLAFGLFPNRDIRPLHDISGKVDPQKRLPAGTAVHRLTVPIRPAQNTRVETYTSKYPANCLRLVENLGDGWFQHLAVGVVSQNGKFFVVTEVMYEPFRCFRSGDDMVCPRWEQEWPALVSFLNENISEEDFEALPPVRDMTEPKAKAKPEPELEPGTAVVIWYSQVMQLGMLQTVEGEASVHWSKVTRPNSRRAYLEAGETVYYEELEDRENTSGRQSGFKKEAKGVRLA
ncbi:MAG: hypothetical protein ACOYUZ_01010 [Patescibacteria group bacterium]